MCWGGEGRKWHWCHGTGAAVHHKSPGTAAHENQEQKPHPSAGFLQRPLLTELDIELTKEKWLRVHPAPIITEQGNEMWIRGQEAIH